MKIKIEILEKGDEIIGFFDNRIAVKKKSGELEIFILSFDNNQLPRVSEDSILFTYGNGRSKKLSITDDKSGLEVGTF